MILWCEKCQIPYYTDKLDKCKICGLTGNYISEHNVIPVFLQEKKLISKILSIDLTHKPIWCLGGTSFLIDGKRKKIPYVKYFQEGDYELIGDELRSKISYNDEIYNEDSWIKANEDYLVENIDEAEKYIKTMYKSYKHICKPIVSFSGGKDSTVVSRLVRDSLQNNKIIHFFGDTTLEMPHTYNYCENIFKEENLFTPLITSKSQKDFLKLCDELGPPSRFERWCCTIFKTSNINRVIQTLPEQFTALTFMGIRRSESSQRRGYERTRKDSKISRQIVAMPIIDWTDFDVWLYIKYKNMEFNDAYKLGYRRVGCWCCPANSKWSELLNAIYIPERNLKWQRLLYSYANKANKEDIDDYIKNEKWKARRGASGLKARNTDIKDTHCFQGVNARNIICEIPITNSFIELLKPFGKLNIQIDNKNTFVNVYENNKEVFSLEFKLNSKLIKVLPKKGYDYLTLIKRLKCQIRKFQYCILCGACDSVCPESAISTVNNNYKIDNSKCVHCKKCIAYFSNGCLTTEVLSEKKGG